MRRGSDGDDPRPYAHLADSRETVAEQDDAALRTAVSEARLTIDHQIDSLDDIDTKAVRLIRVNVILLGLILTALSFATRSTSLSVTDFINVRFGAGITLLLGSTAVAALTYTASDYRVGLSAENIEQIHSLSLTDEELQRVLSNSYRDWIKHNEGTNIRNTPWITLTLFFLVAAITYLSLGCYYAIVGPLPVWADALVIFSLCVFLFGTQFHSQLSDWWDEVTPLRDR